MRIAVEKLPLGFEAGEVGEACALLPGADLAARHRDLLVGKAEALGRRGADRGDEIVAAVHHGGAAHHHGAGREGAEALAQIRGRAVQNAHALERQLERVGGDLRQGGLEPLPQHRRAHAHGHRAVALDRDARVLLARAAALHERNGSEAMVAAVDQPTLQRLLLRPADLAQHALEGRVIVAGVEVGLALVGHELAGRERQLGLGDQVLAAEVHGIEAEITRHHVDEALAEEVGLEPAGRADGADRRLAGHQRFDGDGDVADSIGAGQELRGLRRHHAAVGADIGAHVAVDVAAQAEDVAVARAGDLDVAIDLARVIGRHQVLAAVLDPFHRAADVAGRERDQEILGIELAAHAEAAADVGLDHVDGGLGEPSMGASARRLKNSTLVAPNMASLLFAASHSAIRPRVSSGTPVKRGSESSPRRAYSGLGEAASASPNATA